VAGNANDNEPLVVVVVVVADGTRRTEAIRAQRHSVVVEVVDIVMMMSTAVCIPVVEVALAAVATQNHNGKEQDIPTRTVMDGEPDPTGNPREVTGIVRETRIPQTTGAHRIPMIIQHR
jgi:hypothetical protein